MTKILVILACNYMLTCLNKQSVSSQSITIFSKSGGSLVQSSKKIIHENIHACELNHMVYNMIIRGCQVGYPWGTCKHLYSYHRGSVCPIEYNLHGAATNDVHPACMLKPRPTTEFNTVATWPSTSSRTYARSLVGPNNKAVTNRNRLLRQNNYYGYQPLFLCVFGRLHRRIQPFTVILSCISVGIYVAS
jgi:hypothetical protein